MNVTSQVGRGVATMVARYAIVTPLSFLASVALARLLTPAEFGAFATVSVLVMGLGGLFELGLMSVLIQQPEEPTPQQQRAVFTAYVLVFGALAAVLALAAPLVAPFFHLAGEGVAMLRWLSLNVVLGVIGCVPTMWLERRMRFGVVAVLDVVTLLADKGLAIGLALQGFGVWSFVWASLVAVTLRMGLLTLAAPWPFGLSFDRALIGGQLRRGAWFQGMNLATLARDNLNTFVGGPLYGPTTVGLLNWGLNVPNLVAGNALTIFQRVTFPAFARLHDAPAERARLLALTMRGACLVVVPLLALLVPMGGPIVSFVYGEAWRPALPAMAWFTLRMGTYAIYGPMLWYLNATSRVETAFRATIATMFVELALDLLLIPILGMVGIAAGAGAASAGLAVAMWSYLAREAGLRVGEIVLPGVAIAVPLVLAGAVVAPRLGSLTAFVVALGALGLLWATLAALAERPRLMAWWARRTAPPGVGPGQAPSAPPMQEDPCAPS